MTPQQTLDVSVSRAEIASFETLDSFDVPPDIGRTDETESGGATPRWARLGLLTLLLATAGTYLYNLSASGFGNSFYAAAVEAGSKSWKAMFFGSLDASNFITVDKPPAALWVMDLSARIFGFSTWSVMVPSVLEGVAAVALLYGAVRRVTNPAIGLIAGGVLAMTPVAALMFRFDNPDALLVLLLVGAAYCMTRAIERAGTQWILAVGALLGFAFLTKMMQAFTVVPAFGLAYLIAAPTSLRRRAGQLLGALVTMVIAGGWWVAIVALTPAADRPFIDGSPDNSILNLIFVYNGFGRLSGSGTGSGANFSGAAGIFRLFNEQMGGQASWLLPAALIGMVVVLVARRGAPRTDRLRAAAVIWGGWLIVTGAVFSYGKGVIHTYYTVALAPAIAALVAMGAHQLWKERERTWARAVAALSVLATASWAWVLLDRSPSWNPSLRWIIVVTAVVAAGAIVSAPLRRRAGRVIGVGTAVLVAVACLTGPVAYAADAVATAHTGSIPSAGPTSSNGQIGGGGFPGAAGRSPLAPGGKRSASSTPQSATEGAGTATHGAPALLGGGQGGGPSGIGGGGGAAVTTSSALAKLLEHDAAQFKWVAAVDGSQSAASLELATSGDAVMAIGGFNNEGGNLSLAAFEKYVDAGDVHYYISGSSGGSGGPGGIGGGGGNSDSEITAWVKAHFTSETVGGETVYDLTSASSK